MGSIMEEGSISDSSSSPPPPETAATQPGQSQTAKRTAGEAGLKPNGTRPTKSVKRRASKACSSCRNRKVRCNVVEHGAPCTNCRLDEVDCVVSESKRKKKWSTGDGAEEQQGPEDFLTMNGLPMPMSAHPPYEPLVRRPSEHVPHALYQDLGRDVAGIQTNPTSMSSLYTPNMLLNLQRLGQKPGSISESTPMMLTPTSPSYSLPLYIKPLGSRMNADDIMYLERKGALAIPTAPLRDELLRSFAEYIWPYMPLVDLHEVVNTIDRNDGSQTISLLLFQAIMFAGIAMVDIQHLKNAGYDNRRDARRDFFQKTRLLYDFDIEVDRISLIQSLLLMTYWYETPDDQKDSHHWMGIAVSLSHTIGLHRNPAKSTSMDSSRQRLWKRIWWSTYMRDRLIALGMRRPTRIKNADFDVPMLTVDDFDLQTLPEGPSCIPANSSILRDVEKQRQLAIMCIEKAKLSICISNVLSAQYSVLHNNHGAQNEEGSTRTTTMLGAKAPDSEVNEVEACNIELAAWKSGLADEAHYIIPSWKDVDAGNSDLVLNRSLLHLIYYATLSALHRPQVLPSAAMPPRPQQADQLDVSRKAVRLAASEITSIANRLYGLDLVRYLPTTGITVLLPAIIIHLLDIKAPDEPTRRQSLQGFCQCMQIMAKLRDIYAAADYSTAFLEAAIRKAEITLPQPQETGRREGGVKQRSHAVPITSAQGLLDAGRALAITHHSQPHSSGLEGALTPPPDAHSHSNTHHTDEGNDAHLTDDDIARRLSTFLGGNGNASTPPDSEHHHSEPAEGSTMHLHEAMHHVDFEPDFESMLNLDAVGGDMWALEEGGLGGESSGFCGEMDWMRVPLMEGV